MMVAITVEKKVIKILESFIQAEIANPLHTLSEFNEDEFVFYIKYDKYKACLNAPAAKVIINFQNAVYRIAALHTKRKADIRRLTKKEKQLLEIPFKITEGSTIVEATKLLDAVKELLNIIPEGQRGLTLIAALMIVFSYMSWDRILKYKEKIESMRINSHKRIFELAIDKLHKQNSKLAIIVSNHEKSLITELREIFQEVNVQGINFSEDGLQIVKKEKFSRKAERIDTIKETTNLKGVFTINDINLKNNYLIVEESLQSDPIKIFYRPEDLFTQMQDIKRHLKDAIDNSAQRFHIEAAVEKKNNKVRRRELTNIYEVRNIND